MTISRPTRPRWPAMLAAGIAGVVVGLVLGLALGGGGEDTDSLSRVGDARSSVRQAATVLDIVPVEYGEGVENGRVTSQPEYRGAVGAIARSRALYGEGRPVLAYVDAAQATALDHAFIRLSSAATERVPEGEVARQARRLARALGGAIDG